MDFKKTTESDSNYDRLESMSVEDLLTNINREDQSVPKAIEKIIPAISELIKAIVPRMKQGGRLFYMGAGTSGRLGIVDASECPPTYGIPHGIVVGLIAGGDNAIRKAVEFAEDSTTQGWEDLLNENICDLDTVIGIAASGSTPYVVHALKECQQKNILTGCITCNEGSPITQVSDYPIAAVVGPEFVTGSTRMKAGTAQKLILNMISTSVMIQLGRVKGNKMVDMQLSNNKLIDRGTRMVMNELSIDETTAADLLNKHGNVRAAIDAYNKK
jgi:N-acetylmuramic acid 6-phosphate etherase